MDAREAREWLKTTQRNNQIEKYREYSDDGLRWEINYFRRKAKTAKKLSERRFYEAQIDDIWQELFRRQRENEATE